LLVPGQSSQAIPVAPVGATSPAGA